MNCTSNRLFIVIAVAFTSFACQPKPSNDDKKVFRYNQPDALTSLDPAFARNQGNIRAVGQLYNGLTELDGQLNLRPSLAERFDVSEDGLTYTFYLKKNVRFHDHEVFSEGTGRYVTAEDFVYSFNRLIDPKTASPGAWIFNDKVLRDHKGNISDTCFRAVDDNLLRIYLEKPFPAFPEILAMPYAYVVPKEAVEKYGKDFREHPVGTGPFRFKVWDEENTLVLLKNEHYWKKDSAGNQLPYLDAVQVSFIKDINTEFMTFLQGKVDFLSGLYENAREIVLQNDGRIRSEFADKFTIEYAPYLNTEYIGFQLDSSFYSDKNHPFLNKKFRQALNYAVDRKSLVRNILMNAGIPGTSGIVPSALPSFDADSVQGYSYNPKKAQALLKEAGYPSGKNLPPLKFATVSRFPYRETAEFLQKQWAAVGITVETAIHRTGSLIEMADNGRVHFFRASWLGDYPDAENYLSLFYSKNFAPSGPNKTHFSNAEFDRLYEKSLTVTQPKERFILYRKMDQIIADKAPVIVLFYDVITRLSNKRIKNLNLNAMNTLNLERVDIISAE